MSELIAIRECARRLGVSDTAVHKAIKKGRINIHSRGEYDRPLLDWDDVATKWDTESARRFRTHSGGSHGRAETAVVELAKSYEHEKPSKKRGSESDGTETGFVNARAEREIWEAKMAKLKFEQLSGDLVSADEIKREWVKLISAAKSKILSIPSAVKSRFHDLPIETINEIDHICRITLEDLAHERD